MIYLYHSKDDQDDVIADAIIQREREHHHYEVNRLNYLAMLSAMNADVTIPKQWPANLVQYQNVFGEQLAAQLSGADYLTVTTLQHRDRVRMLLATTISEQNKVEGVYNALTTALPAGLRRDAAVARCKAKAV